MYAKLDRFIVESATGSRPNRPPSLGAHFPLRASLAVIFIWFGALKLADRSPATMLIDETLPDMNIRLIMLALGVVEIVIGIALMIAPRHRFVLMILVMHLSGTLLSFLSASELTLDHGNPFLLTFEGEFVIKNIVLISGALTLRNLLHNRPAQRTEDEVTDDHQHG